MPDIREATLHTTITIPVEVRVSYDIELVDEPDEDTLADHLHGIVTAAELARPAEIGGNRFLRLQANVDAGDGTVVATFGEPTVGKITFTEY